MTDSYPHLRAVVLDATDARALAEFYRQLLGYEYRAGDEAPPSGEPDPRGADWLVLRDASGGARLAVQNVADLPRPPGPTAQVPQQLHLDLTVADADALAASATGRWPSARACCSTAPPTPTSSCTCSPTRPATRSASSSPPTIRRELGVLMPEEFEGDLAGAVFWGADLSGARFRDVNLTGATISHAWLVDVDIDALVDRVVINGVDVTDYVNERDPWYPLRAMIRPTDPQGMREAWAALEAGVVEDHRRGAGAPRGRACTSPSTESSPSSRRCDTSSSRWTSGSRRPSSESPSTRSACRTRGSVDFPWPGLDYALTPSVAEVLAVRADRATRLRDFLVSVSWTTSPAPSTCWRTARTRCRSASTPSSKRSSGTTATPVATSPS